MVSYHALQLHVKIRQIREIRHLTREYVADALNIAYRTYADIESGKASVTVQRLFELCAVFNCTSEDILHFTPGSSLGYDAKAERDKSQIISYYRQLLITKDDLIQQLRNENDRLSEILRKKS